LQAQSEARQRQRAEAAARKELAKRVAASRPPARQWLEEVIPETVFSDSDGMRNAECPVCLQNLRDKAAAAAEKKAAAAAAEKATSLSPPPELLSVRTLHCGHGGCRACVDEWLLSGADSCPVCRASVLTSTQHAQLFEAAAVIVAAAIAAAAACPRMRVRRAAAGARRSWWRAARVQPRRRARCSPAAGLCARCIQLTHRARNRLVSTLEPKTK
jgi:hypothetical protein